GSTVRDRDRQSGIRHERWFRIKRVRCTLTWWLFPSLMLCRGSGTDLLFPDDHYGSNGPPRSTRFCAYCDRTGVDADPSDRNPGYESLGESGTEYRSGHLCWRMGTRTTLVILAGPDHRRHGGRRSVRCNLRVKNRNGRDPSSEQE